MDSKRFDTWTRNRALRFSRRDGLRLAAAGGAVKLAAGQFESFAQTSCTFTLHAETLAGPSAPTTYDGSLIFSVGADGALAQASFTPDGGAPAPVNGSLSGRAFDLSIELGSGETLALSGAADASGPDCPTAVAGIFSGPQPGDLGAWLVTSGPNAAQTSSQPSSGQASTSSSSTSACPQGQVACGGNCVATCPTGETLDQSSCSCAPSAPACGPDQSPCDFDFECCGGACRDNACTTCPGLLCGDMGCVDNLSDPNNCGTCGTVCSGDTPICLDGACQCIPDGEPVEISSSSCCSKTYLSTTLLCGCASLGEWCDGGGDCCDNAAGVVCISGRGGFKICCIFPGDTCASDSDCCAATNKCIAGVCQDPV